MNCRTYYLLGARLLAGSGGGAAAGRRTLALTLALSLSLSLTTNPNPNPKQVRRLAGDHVEAERCWIGAMQALLHGG